MKKWVKSIATGIVLLGLIQVGAKADTLLQWSTTSLSGITTGNLNSTATGVNMNTGVLSRGSGFTATSLSGGYASSAAYNSTTSLALATTNNTYYQFTVSAADGYTLSLDEFDIAYRATSTGGRDTQLEYSLDGFATAGILVGTNAALPQSTSSTSFTIDLSGESALQGVLGTVTFRLYTWNDTNGGASGTAALYNNAITQILGTTSILSIPEPSTYALMGAGAGILILVQIRRRKSGQQDS